MQYRLALVEYLNTFPFSEGIRLTGLDREIEVRPVTPAQCAKLFETGEADISLCPVGALVEMPEHQIRGNYCIGADGEVGTVVLLSNIPLDSIRKIRLDDHSRTSNLLLQVLGKNYWKKDFEYYQDDEASPESCLMIGDKVFDHRSKYSYAYDLAATWKSMTGLPMVFAVWIAKPEVPPDVITSIDRAFEIGMEKVMNGHSGLDDWQRDYLLNFISYPLDAKKKEALTLYQRLCAGL